MSALPPLESMETLIDNLHATKNERRIARERIAVSDGGAWPSNARLPELLKKIDVADRVALIPKPTACIRIKRNFA